MKRKLAAITMAAIMGLSLTACGSSGGDNSSSDGENTTAPDNADELIASTAMETA